MYRELLALVVAPLMVPAVFLVGLYLVGDESDLTFGNLFFLVGLPAYLVAWVLGLPVAVLFRAASQRALWLHVVAGLFLGGAAGHAVDWLFYYGQADWELVFLSWTAGGVSAVAYWVLAHKVLAAVEQRDRALYGR